MSVEKTTKKAFFEIQKNIIQFLNLALCRSHLLVGFQTQSPLTFLLLLRVRALDLLDRRVVGPGIRRHEATSTE